MSSGGGRPGEDLRLPRESSNGEGPDDGISLVIALIGMLCALLSGAIMGATVLAYLIQKGMVDLPW